jgi:hypothetical protein
MDFQSVWDWKEEKRRTLETKTKSGSKITKSIRWHGDGVLDGK